MNYSPPSPPIKIYPVANGWVLELPEYHENESDKIFEKFPDMLHNLQKALQKDPELAEIEKLEKQFQKDVKNESLQRSGNIHIFLKFSELLAFLSLKYED